MRARGLAVLAALTPATGLTVAPAAPATAVTSTPAVVTSSTLLAPVASVDIDRYVGT